MKVDFHLHTPASIQNGDSINWSTPNEIIKKLWVKGVQAFAFTDHNVLDSSLYIQTRNICKTNLLVFPGVEVSVLKPDGIIAHLLLLFDKELEDKQVKDLEEICRLTLRKRGISIEAVYEIFKDFDFIAIPHVGKGDYFDVEDLTFEHQAIEITSKKHHNYKKWLKNLDDKSVVAFSDTHSWKDYPQNNTFTTDIDFDGSFKDLKLKLSLNKDYTK